MVEICLHAWEKVAFFLHAQGGGVVIFVWITDQIFMIPPASIKGPLPYVAIVLP